jgi:structural maintenance of chromosome 4
MERAIPKLRAEVAAAKERAVDLRGRLGELDAAAKTSKEDAAELKKLEREVVAATEALEQVQAGAAGIRARCVGLQEDMDSVGGNTLKKQRALVKAGRGASAGVHHGRTVGWIPLLTQEVFESVVRAWSC